MEIRNARDLKDLIRNEQGKTDNIKLIVQNSVMKNPVSMFTIPTLIRYLSADMQRSLATQVMS